jgi:hypothetical protein
MAEMCAACKGTGKVLAKGTTEKPKGYTKKPSKAAASSTKPSKSKA